MTLLKKTVLRLLQPLLTLNLAGMAAAAVWLGLLSQWQVIWIGVTGLVFSPYIIPVLMLPAGIFSHFMTAYQASGQRRRERAMFVCSIAYILSFFTFWCAGIFYYVTHSVKPEALGAGMMWAGAAAMVPLLMWISRDRENIFMLTLVEVAQLSLWTLTAIRLFAGVAGFWPSFAVFGGLMLFAVVLQALWERRAALTVR